MPPTLAASISIGRYITLTEPVAVPCWARVGQAPYAESVLIVDCSGSGPYVCCLADPAGAHMAGTSVTVLG